MDSDVKGRGSEKALGELLGGGKVNHEGLAKAIVSARA
jgi:hypothetical protein